MLEAGRIRIDSSMKQFLFTLVFVVAMFPGAVFSAEEISDKTKEGVQAAEAWLKLVDEEKFVESWKEAAPYFQGKISEGQWVKALSGVRTPLGPPKSRNLLRAQFATSLPDAPDGEYVVIQFQTDFAGKPAAVETVTPMKDDQGVWRVSGYFIK